MRRTIGGAAMIVALAGVAGPAAAGHDDRHCAVTIHEHLGTDDLLGPLPLPDEVPNDIGWIKVYLLCEH